MAANCNLGWALIGALAGVWGGAAAAPLAFPTATGFGKHAAGGRGGDVYIVSTLNDTGAGSLRACVEAAGPRTCVFAIGGEIQLDAPLHAVDPYLTIAGQSAPGGGVQITNRFGPNDQAPLFIDTHDVVVRHIRVRPGPSAEPSSNVDAVLIRGHRVILDHVSMSWSTDELLNVIGNGGLTGNRPSENSRDITVQWSILAEPLNASNHPSGEHGFAAFFSDGVRDASFNHNLIAHVKRRGPNVGAIGQFDFLGNVTYNFQDYAAEIYSQHGSSFINWAGNMSIVGPNSVPQRWRAAANLFRNSELGEFSIYMGANLDHVRTDLRTNPEWTLDKKDWKYLSTSPVGYGSMSADFPTLDDPQQNYKDVLAFAGATAPARDAVDARIVGDVASCGGGIVDDPSDRGGWPNLAPGEAPADADQDGMPDAWERDRGLDPSNPADRNGDADGNGYTDLEDYLNELAGDFGPSPHGRGARANAAPTCGYAVPRGPDVVVARFDLVPNALRAGQKVKIYFTGYGDSCKKSWDLENPNDNNGVWSLRPQRNLSLDVTCTDGGLEDIANRIVYVNNERVAPAPQVALSASTTRVAAGGSVVLEWTVDEPQNANAGLCEASGLWSGYRSVLGVETIRPEQSGEARLTCAGPGGVDVAVAAIEVEAAAPSNEAPTASVSANPTRGQAPFSVSFSGAGSSDPDGAVAAYAWDLDGDGATDANGATASFTYDDPGTYNARLTVTDDDGASAAASVTITVDEPAPSNEAPSAAASASPTRGEAPLTVASSSAGSADPDGTIATRAWDFDGDGVADAMGASPSFVYGDPGTYNARLTVTDDVGASDQASVTIIVDAPAPPADDFGVGARVEAAVNVQVRAAPGGSRRGRQPPGSPGVIVGGPGSDDGFVYWRVDFATGDDGWMREVDLRLAP
ncbi:MAG: PKD domain-containing protein [Parvularculaceae bacterium]